MRFNAKDAGAYYTPEGVVSSLLRWALHSEEDRLLDPSCGDGRFIADHRNSVGIEQDLEAAATAMARAPWALIHEGDFFVWAAHTTERFDCAAGNPPFIRYQSFDGETQHRTALGAHRRPSRQFDRAQPRHRELRCGVEQCARACPRAGPGPDPWAGQLAIRHAPRRGGPGSAGKFGSGSTAHFG